jgi:hypothetical protein
VYLTFLPTLVCRELKVLIFFSEPMADFIHNYSNQIQPYLPYVVVPLGIYSVYKILCRLIPGPHHQQRLVLRDKTVLITGASSGLGRALAFEFYKKASY